ncbi:MAG: multidrug transporter subunit MdtC [Planctomycetaceae bacterium]|nr:multidrug transporter subunit MdtC [Planctomycetaceae bacterium]
MNISTWFIRHPIGTSLLAVAITLVGAICYFLLPVSPLPQVEYPTINVGAGLPGASSETMASAVATPLERQFGLIAGVTEMTSQSTLGQSSITLQFDLDRNIDAATRDVQAAINAARGRLPANLPRNPDLRKVNPADAPILILAMTSDLHEKPRLQDVASTLLQQKLSQVQGVGQVVVSGGSPPAVRVAVNPMVLERYDLGLDDVRTCLQQANTNRPKGSVDDGVTTWSIATTDQLFTAAEYRQLIVAWRRGAAIRLGDVATVVDSVEDVRVAGVYNARPTIMLILYRQPNANIIRTVDNVLLILPQLRAQIPAGMRLDLAMDRTATIRASIVDVQHTLLLSVGLVVGVVFLFLRDWRATLIPSVVVPVSLVSTFSAMYALGYSLDNLSLMALTIATGFVVDDAIVVLENIARHREEGMSPMAAAFLGAREIGFTVLSISISLVAVFIPILLMGGIVGRLFREFAVTLSVAILVSMVVSLTLTPMMCAWLLRPAGHARQGLVSRLTERFLDGVTAGYGRLLGVVMRHPRITMAVNLATIALTVWMYVIVPKGFFPQQDTGRITGTLDADQDTSFQTMSGLLTKFSLAIKEDPAVAGITGSTGGAAGGSPNAARMFISLVPKEERDGMAADQVIGRLRGKLSQLTGATMIMQPVQDLRIGGRPSSSQYQFTLRGDNLTDLNEWGPKLVRAMRAMPELTDIRSDQQNRGLQAGLTIDRDAAARFGISPRQIDDALYDAFGQRQVSVMYRPLGQYRVVMGLESGFLQGPDGLSSLHVTGSSGLQVPLESLASLTTGNAPLMVNHTAQFPSATVSFNLAPGVSLGEAVEAVETKAAELGMPATVRGSFSGTAQVFREALANQPLLILAAVVTVYLVLGMLYESIIHPLTIISTLPSAGLGALLALQWTGSQLDVMAMIGIILLIGIVKKNAIMMIDFALEAERTRGLSPRDAIVEACILRFRPITMTTLAALLGGLPLALGTGPGAELRWPLGIAIVGGLIVSQMLTLFTTPVVYLYLDSLVHWLSRRRAPAAVPPPAVVPTS